MIRLKTYLTNSIYIFLLIFICLSFFGCSILLLTDETAHVSFEHTDKFLVVVEKDLYPSLEQKLDQYAMDLKDEGSVMEYSIPIPHCHLIFLFHGSRVILPS